MSERSNYSWLGIDTSNYTTSVGLIGPGGEIQNYKKMLPVNPGNKGLRQSEALFLHIKQFDEVFGRADLANVGAVGVSVRPRNVEGSYMPCFLAGAAFARTVARSLGVPLYEFSHQQGHIAAGMISAGFPEKKRFLAFHASGGTMELLLVEDMENISVIGRSLDITCGQLIDRIGVKLGYQFPAGAYVEKAASGGVLTDVPQICLKGLDCCMSGFENKADALISSGAEPGTVCLYTLEAVRRTVSAMVAQARSLMGDLPCLFVGGVMSDVYVKDGLSVLGNVFFAAPELSGDNAVGIAYLAGFRHEGGIG